ncbi:MAG: UDP-N-acetylglucosamine 2-epimerase (non-hydrolyzing) [Candidatus Hadarchaeales archaeon]
MKVACVFGTRPEIIKLSPVIEECGKTGLDVLLVHTGQHYDYEMSDIFLQELGVPNPNYHLGIRTENPLERFSEIITRLERVLKKEEPDFMLAQGDTDTVPASLFVARRSGIPGGHVEAGLRSFNQASPEELNRKLASRLALLHFAPTELNREFLLSEGVDPANIFVTGNTIVDVVGKVRKRLKSEILSELEIRDEKPILLVTVHRPGNVDNKNNLSEIFGALCDLKEFQIVFPIHPRTEKRAAEFGLLQSLQRAEHVKVIKPLGYLDFLSLMSKCDLILTDSGGLQEEACEFKKPVVVMRETTPRWESVLAGFAFLAGTKRSRITATVQRIAADDGLKKKLRKTKNPFGDGKASKRIARILRRLGNKIGYPEPDEAMANSILRKIRRMTRAS